MGHGAINYGNARLILNRVIPVARWRLFWQDEMAPDFPIGRNQLTEVWDNFSGGSSGSLKMTSDKKSQQERVSALWEFFGELKIVMTGMDPVRRTKSKFLVRLHGHCHYQGQIPNNLLKIQRT